MQFGWAEGVALREQLPIVHQFGRPVSQAGHPGQANVGGNYGAKEKPVAVRLAVHLHTAYEMPDCRAWMRCIEHRLEDGEKQSGLKLWCAGNAVQQDTYWDPCCYSTLTTEHSRG